jgi:flavin reductase (DIM6/NTAB) family NADH-FMN oxidoreductase RutF
MAITSDEFKQALGRFTTGVAVAATSYQGKCWGITVNSLASVSLQPPLVLFSIDKTAQSYQAFTAGRDYSINILSRNQSEFSRHFTQSAQTQWDTVPHRLMQDLPAITDACATLLCKPYAQHDGGDHTILVGEIMELRYGEAEPLVYYRGEYGGV